MRTLCLSNMVAHPYRFAAERVGMWSREMDLGNK